MTISDYETYWSDREKEGTEGEENEVVREESVLDTFDMDGETVEVEINGEYVTFYYQNGTDRTLPISDLYFCPKCLKKMVFPFCDGADDCKVHGHEVLKFDLKEYENFKLVSQMYGGMLVPQ